MDIKNAQGNSKWILRRPSAFPTGQPFFPLGENRIAYIKEMKDDSSVTSGKDYACNGCHL